MCSKGFTASSHLEKQEAPLTLRGQCDRCRNIQDKTRSLLKSGSQRLDWYNA